MSNIRNTLARSTALKAAYHQLRREFMEHVCDFSPDLPARYRYRRASGRWPNLKCPETFDEKLQWLNLFWRNPLKARCADRLALRGFVEGRGLAHLLPKLFGVYSAAVEIRVDTLPERFVLKCTHGCKCNLFCLDKQKFDWKAAQNDLDFWMRLDFSKFLGELHYGEITPHIICEEFLRDGNWTQLLPVDYKVYCFRGRAYCTMVAIDRQPNEGAKLAFYDLEWKPLPYCLPHEATGREIPEPPAYAEIIYCAQELSKPFPFVRVDFYSISGRARLGEMTFTPAGCVTADYINVEGQRELGALIDLPEALL